MLIGWILLEINLLIQETKVDKYRQNSIIHMILQQTSEVLGKNYILVRKYNYINKTNR